MQRRNPEDLELLYRLGEREQAVLRSAAGRPAAKPDLARSAFCIFQASQPIKFNI